MFLAWPDLGYGTLIQCLKLGWTSELHCFCVEAPSQKGRIIKPPGPFWFLNSVCVVFTWEIRLYYWIPQDTSPFAKKFIFEINSILNLGQTVEKPRVQPGKTVPREFPRAQPEGTPEGQFFRLPEAFQQLVRLW